MRIRAFPVSAINRSPWLSTATSPGALRVAAVAGPLSPLKDPHPEPAAPEPAAVDTTPINEAIFRTRQLPVSARYRLPEESSAMPRNPSNCAVNAGPESPPNEDPPPPAMVDMTPVEALTRRMRPFPVSAMIRLPCASTARLSGRSSAAAVAGPLSPPEPAVPLPATVVMMPDSASIRRTRWFAVSAIKTLN
jgi:hypothetical protein